MLAIQAGNSGQGIDENPVTVHKGVQSDFISQGVWISVHKVCCRSSISGSISGNLGDFSQLKLNSGFAKGQIISEWLLDVFIWTKKRTKNISVFLP